MGLHADHALQPAAVPGSHLDFRGGQGLFRNAAQALQADKAVVLDTADDEAQAVHMGEDHQHRRAGLGSLDFGHAIAQGVGHRGQAAAGELLRQQAADRLLKSGQARREDQAL